MLGKTLVVYYSRTGMTAKVAMEIARVLDCDIEEIIDLKDRSGAMGYLIAGRDALKKELAEIKKIEKNPEDYDLLVIGTPVWAFTMASAIRTYVVENKDKFKNVAFFATQGGEGAQRKFKDLKELTGKTPVFEIQLLTKEVTNGSFKGKLEELLKEYK
ncbi:MAG: flavodoxin [Candidatus Gracilibacteria bacterium]|nr:flavodoxin [Candidatus Gracilibacteria bacterium]MDD4530901.1 flavodoxin [Candidatus Gracilibacteria bacterium]